jgi:hypothetical protein
MFVVPFLLFVIAKGREYYVAPAYPMLYAAGSVRVEAWLESLRSPWAGILRRLVTGHFWLDSLEPELGSCSVMAGRGYG